MGVAGAVGSGCNSSSNTTPSGDGGVTPDGSTGSTGSTGADGGPGPDGSTGPGPDGGKKDGSAEAGPPPVSASLVIAHVAPGVPPVRVCFATGTGTPTVTPISALPDNPSGAPAVPATSGFPAVAAGTPGIYPGTIGAFPTITDLQPITITPFAILASSIAGDINYDGGVGVGPDGGVEEDCVHLIGTHGLGTAEVAPAKAGRLVLGMDFFPLASIPAGTLKDSQTYLLTINGCLPGGEVSAAAAAAGYTCGPGDAGPTIGIGQLDTTTAVPDGGIGVQFMHRSVSMENTPIVCTGADPACPAGTVLHTPASAGVWPTLIQPGIVGTVPNDGGLDEAGNPIDAGVSPVFGPLPAPVGDAAAGPVKYDTQAITPMAILPLTETDPATSFFGVVVAPLDGGAPNYKQWPPGDLFALPLSGIDQLSAWAVSTKASPTSFVAGQSYTFVLVGDPAAAQLPNPDGGSGINPAWDGRGMHIVAFPNNFTPF
jgi:hypothetical protein